MRNVTLRNLAGAVLALGSWACGGSGDGPPSQPSETRTLDASPDGVSLVAGTSQQLSARLVTGTGSTAATVAWRSVEPAVATVTAAGLLAGVTAGYTPIVATVDGLYDTVFVAVLPAEVSQTVAPGGTIATGDISVSTPSSSPPVEITIRPVPGESSPEGIIPGTRFVLEVNGSCVQSVLAQVAVNGGVLPPGVSPSDLQLFELVAGAWKGLGSAGGVGSGAVGSTVPLGDCVTSTRVSKVELSLSYSANAPKLVSNGGTLQVGQTVGLVVQKDPAALQAPDLKNVTWAIGDPAVLRAEATSSTADEARATLLALAPGETTVGAVACTIGVCALKYYTNLVSFTVVPASATTGTLQVNVVGGLPAGAKVQVSGPNGFSQALTGTTTLTNRATGSYTVTASPVASGVKTYNPTVTGSPATVTANATATVTVTYVEVAVVTVRPDYNPLYDLSPGTGTISSSSQGGFSCSNSGGTCTQTLPIGTSLTLQATPSTNSNFMGWQGGGCPTSPTATCTLTVSGPVTITAYFALKGYSYSVKMVGAAANGTVSDPANPVGQVLDCRLVSGAQSGNCSANESFGDRSHWLEAQAATGSVFLDWSGDCAGFGTCEIKPLPGGSRSVTATFAGPHPGTNITRQSYSVILPPPRSCDGIVGTNIRQVNFAFAYADAAGDFRTDRGAKVYVQIGSGTPFESTTYFTRFGTGYSGTMQGGVCVNFGSSTSILIKVWVTDMLALKSNVDSLTISPN
jgi:hypothetical protein